MATVEFTDNYEDLSTETGYQFRFKCERCGNGYQSSFQTSKAGVMGSMLRGASHLLGGIFGRVAAGSEDLRRMVAGPAHDGALRAAVQEIRPLFHQCSRCGQWVCGKICWNPGRDLCKQCAPDLGEEIASRQAAVAAEQAEERIRTEDQTEGRELSRGSKAKCPKCGEAVKGGKFCENCGADLAPRRKCPGCGAQAEGQAKFCPQCGGKL